MPRTIPIFFSTILIVGFLDWLTTVTGILFCGATEVNPLMSGLTSSSMVLFSAVKLTAVALAGVAFYKAAAIIKPTSGDGQFTSKFIIGGFSLTVFALLAVVANNVVTILSVS